MSKGSKRRPMKIGSKESDLRWELFKSSTTSERKEEIIKELERIKDA